MCEQEFLDLFAKLVRPRPLNFEQIAKRCRVENFELVPCVDVLAHKALGWTAECYMGEQVGVLMHRGDV